MGKSAFHHFSQKMISKKKLGNGILAYQAFQLLLGHLLGPAALFRCSGLGGGRSGGRASSMAGVRDPAGGALVGRGALASGDTLVEKRATSSKASGGERHGQEK